MRWVLSGRISAGRLATMAALMLAMLLLMAARPAEAQGTGVYHIVQRGEYLSVIAQRYGTTTQAILAANPQITNPNLIFAGQTIFVPFGTQPPPPPPPPPTPVPPSPPPQPACRAWHYVTPGQTMLMISRWYGVAPFAIARANNIFNLNLIYAGSTLCIP
ncbi:MAG TPA: LysM domain-containing protein [Promineifilum sp.]|nr:LysM domain-containing protein [Promineifilum sp.]